MLSDARGARRDLGLEDDIAAVRQRGRERDGDGVPVGECFYVFCFWRYFWTEADIPPLLTSHFMVKKIKSLCLNANSSRFSV